MYDKLTQLIPIRAIIYKIGTSERELAKKCGLSRLTIRSLIQGYRGSRLSSWVATMTFLDRGVSLVSHSEATNCDLSVQSICYQVMKDGPGSWKIHFMNFVDEFRRSLDGRLILLPPPKDLDENLKALIASIVHALCNELKMDTPTWAKRKYILKKPWFVSESENLKAMMILESPLEFRRNQIFVGENFLDRT